MKNNAFYGFMSRYFANFIFLDYNINLKQLNLRVIPSELIGRTEESLIG